MFPKGNINKIDRNQTLLVSNLEHIFETQLTDDQIQFGEVVS